MPKVDETLKNKLRLLDLTQIGIVVKDLNKAIEYYSTVFGIGPFKAMHPKFHNKTYRGKPTDFDMKLAFTNWKPVQVELIEPLRGQNIYYDFLKKNPDGGIHHLGYEVPDLDEAINNYARNGINVIQGGRVEGGGHAYFDTESLLGFIIEVFQTPPGWPTKEEYL